MTRPEWAKGNVAQWWTYGRTLVEFKAFFIEPDGVVSCVQKLPLAVCFLGLGSRCPDVSADVRRVATEPFVLVVPSRPKGLWWFIDDCTKYGWIQGSVRHELIRLYGQWICSLADRKEIDSDRVGIFGHSAGAYAALEVMMAGNMWFSGVGLSGVHGHGQWDCREIPHSLHKEAQSKFSDFLGRVAEHRGAGFIHVTHAVKDRCSMWEDASLIISALDVGQNLRGSSMVIIRPLTSPEDLDTAPTSERNKLWHDYFNAAFCRSDFFRRLLGGEFVYQPARRAAAAELPQATRGRPSDFQVQAAFTGLCRVRVQLRPVPLETTGEQVKTTDEQPRAWVLSKHDVRHAVPNLKEETPVEPMATKVRPQKAHTQRNVTPRHFPRIRDRWKNLPQTLGISGGREAVGREPSVKRQTTFALRTYVNIPLCLCAFLSPEKEQFERGPHGAGRPKTMKELCEFTNRRGGFKASLDALGDGYWEFWKNLPYEPRSKRKTRPYVKQ